jgi:hypothetical protein
MILTTPGTLEGSFELSEPNRKGFPALEITLDLSSGVVLVPNLHVLALILTTFFRVFDWHNWPPGIRGGN